jgi:putative SOS response-associated peptidase YedK
MLAIEADADIWINGTTDEAFSLARPYPADGMRIVHAGEKQEPFRA